MTSPINPNSAFKNMPLSSSKDNKQVSSQQQTERTQDIKPSIAAINKKQLNAAIVQSSIQYSGSIADKPNTLLLKTALQGINDSLKEMGVETTVEETHEKSEIDFSPEATAERILSFSTQFLGAYQRQNPEMDEQEAIRSFVDVIEGGIKQGFAEAREVLDGLNVLEGDIADNIDKTYQIIEQGLQDFIDSFAVEEDTPETES